MSLSMHVDLPDELWCKIFVLLTPIDARRLLCTCWRIANMSQIVRKYAAPEWVWRKVEFVFGSELLSRLAPSGALTMRIKKHLRGEYWTLINVHDFDMIMTGNTLDGVWAQVEPGVYSTPGYILVTSAMHSAHAHYQSVGCYYYVRKDDKKHKLISFGDINILLNERLKDALKV